MDKNFLFYEQERNAAELERLKAQRLRNDLTELKIEQLKKQTKHEHITTVITILISLLSSLASTTILILLILKG